MYDNRLRAQNALLLLIPDGELRYQAWLLLLLVWYSVL